MTFAPSTYSTHNPGCPCLGCGAMGAEYGLMGLGVASADDIVAAYGISRELAQKIVQVSNRVGISDPAMLANVINFESRFNPQAVNPSSGATGLIQFIGPTARELGTTTSALRGMSAVQQMEYVARYFELPRIKSKGPYRTQLDTMMAVFSPNGVGKGASFWLGFSPATIAANHGIATAGQYLEMAMRNARLTPNDSFTGQVRSTFADFRRITLLSMLGIGIGLGGWYAYNRYQKARPNPEPTDPSLYWTSSCARCAGRVWIRRGTERPGPYFCSSECQTAERLWPAPARVAVSAPLLTQRSDDGWDL